VISRASSNAPATDVPRNQTRVFAFTHEEAQTRQGVVTGIFSISDIFSYVLIDPGSDHSDVSTTFACHLHIPLIPLDKEIVVHTSLGGRLIRSHCYSQCRIMIDG